MPYWNSVTVRQHGVTLIELLVTLAVIAILATITVPSFQNFIERSNRDAAAAELFNALQFARAEAVRRGTEVSLRSQSTTANNEWGENGWCVVLGTPANCSGAVIREYGAVSQGVTTDSGNNRPLITFTASGTTTTTDTFITCRGPGEGLSIALLRSGIARRTNTNCP